MSSLNALVLASLVETAEAEEPYKIPYHLPSPKEVQTLCTHTQDSCDPSIVENACAKQKAEIDARVKQYSDKDYYTNFGQTKEDALASWSCSSHLLAAPLCTLNLSEQMKADKDSDGKVTFAEAFGDPMAVFAERLSVGGPLMSPFGYEMKEATMDGAIRGLVYENFCPVDANKDGLISSADDSDGNGMIDNADRQKF